MGYFAALDQGWLYSLFGKQLHEFMLDGSRNAVPVARRKAMENQLLNDNFQVLRAEC